MPDESILRETAPGPVEGDNHRALRRRIREALAAGLLPLGRIGSVVGRGTGRPCFICGHVIVPSDLEHEVQTGPRGETTVMVHEPCYLLWRVETMARIGKAAL